MEARCVVSEAIAIEVFFGTGVLGRTNIMKVLV